MNFWKLGGKCISDLISIYTSRCNAIFAKKINSFFISGIHRFFYSDVKFLKAKK